MSPVLRLCSLSTILCPLSCVSVPSLTALFLVSRPLYPVPRLCSLSPVLCTLSHVSVPCLPFSLPCLTWSASCHPSSFLRPLTPINCPIVSPFQWLYSTVPVVCSVSCPLFLCFLSSVPCPLSLVLCLLSSVPCPLSSVSCPLSLVPCPLSCVSCLSYLREWEFTCFSGRLKPLKRPWGSLGNFVDTLLKW